MTIKELIEHLKDLPDDAHIQTDGGEIKHILCDEFPPTGKIILVTLSNE